MSVGLTEPHPWYLGSGGDTFCGPDSLERITRDVCFFYHEMSAYGGFMEDFGPWELIDVPPWVVIARNSGLMDNDEWLFVRQGALTMVLTLALADLKGTSSDIRPYLTECVRAVSFVEPVDEHDAALVAITAELLDLVARDGRLTSALEDRIRWAYRHFVEGYFRERGRPFAVQVRDHCRW